MGDWGGEPKKEGVSIVDVDQRLEEKIGVVGLEALDADDGLALLGTFDSVRVKHIRSLSSEFVVAAVALEGVLQRDNSSPSCGVGSAGFSLDKVPYLGIQLSRRRRVRKLSPIAI